MPVTALAPQIGCERASEIAKLAHRRGISLRRAALGLGYVGAGDYERGVVPAEMIHPAGR